MKTQQIGSIANELKALGIDSPESLVEGLPIDGKIKALSQLKERLVKLAPMTKAPENMHTTASRAEQDKAMFNQVLFELGIDNDSYNRVMNGGKL